MNAVSRRSSTSLAASSVSNGERNDPTVLFVSLPAALGGSNRSLVTLLESLSGSVHRVLAAPAGGAFAEFVSTRDVADEQISLLRKGPIRRLRRVVDGAHIALWAVRNRRRLHAIHANATTGLTVASLAGFLTRRPVIVWVHDPVSSPWGLRLGPWVRRIVPSLSVAAVSSTAESVAVEMGLCDRGEATIVPNPIDPDDVVFQNREPHDGVTIGVLGGSSHRKGFDLLPAVVADVEDLPATWLLYVNPEPNPDNTTTWDQLAPFLDSSVQVPGRTRDVREAYAASDIVFCPSREESFCRIAAEAMVNGIPVVGTAIEPLEYLLGDGAGLVFPLGDTAGAAEAIRYFIQHPEERLRAGEIGKRRSAEFSPPSIAAAMLGLYGVDPPSHE